MEQFIGAAHWSSRSFSKEETVRKKNRLMEMVERRYVPLGIQCFTGHPALIEVLGRTGFDWVMIDTEHSSNNPRALEDTIRVIENCGMVSVVRVPDLHDETSIRRALEAGAEALLLPLVKSADDIRRAADAAFFPPKGKRGICPSFRAAGYDIVSFPEYAEWNNSEVLLIPMFEHPEGIENVEEICAMEEVKALVFAPGDLAFFLGEGMHMRAPRVSEAYKKVMAAAKRHNVAVIGGPINDPAPDTCRRALDEGVSIFCLGLDTMGFRRFCEQTVAALNSGVEGTSFNRPPAPPTGFPPKI
jgi:2-keto-3-deoxy-L-rhamnonate aldolase RhmA